MLQKFNENSVNYRNLQSSDTLIWLPCLKVAQFSIRICAQ